MDPSVEEALERLYLCEVEQEEYPSDETTAAAVKNAASLGLVELCEHSYRLTRAGRTGGRSVVRRHRLAESLLRDVLAVGSQHMMEEEACRFEHVLLDGLDDKICILLGHPATCPHGKTIPEGECCRKAKTDQISEVGPLCDGKAGSEGVVSYLTTRNNREVQKMMAMGILPGTPIQLIRCFPSYVFQAGYSQFTVDRSLAEIIYVHWNTSRTP